MVAVMRLPVGLIPAHTGKTGRVPVASHKLGAHLRSRGENGGAGSDNESAAGSSPLTRGKRFGKTIEAIHAGLIPAHAGKTTSSSSDCSPTRAHPRSRGENAAEETAVDIHLGSSPLTRGKPDRRCGGIRKRRLIPAHAGKTGRSGCS